MSAGPREPGGLDQLIVVMAASEIDALLGGHVERFPMRAADRDLTIELMAVGFEPAPGPAPDYRLRVAPDALRASRVGTVTPLFPDRMPFTLTLMCSDAAPEGPTQIAPGLSYDPRTKALRATSTATPTPPRGEGRERLGDRVSERLLAAAGVMLAAVVIGIVRGADDLQVYLGIGVVGAVLAFFSWGDRP